MQLRKTLFFPSIHESSRRNTMKKTIELEKQCVANYYRTLPVVLIKGEGVYTWDEEGKRYIDMMSAYSAISHGHCHPILTKIATEQLNTLSVVSRAYHTKHLGAFLNYACKLFGYDKAAPLNTGAEAVEFAVKAARKWAYEAKNVPENKAEIIVCENNFHGRTTTIISFSSEAGYKKHFGPYTPGFNIIPYGNSDALEKAITPNTAAFLVEPVQGEAGIIFPPEGYLAKCAEICKKHNVLLICDEIQTGLGRTGKLLASDHENVKPDGLILGKALGGGIYPVSLFLAKNNIMDLFKPGDHGSTFGGNALASRIGLAALETLIEERLPERSAELGDYMLQQLRKIKSPLIKDLRGKGLFIGMEINTDLIDPHKVCLHLLENGILSKETHETVIRFAPPLIITHEQIDEAISIIKKTLEELHES